MKYLTATAARAAREYQVGSPVGMCMAARVGVGLVYGAPSWTHFCGVRDELQALFFPATGLPWTPGGDLGYLQCFALPDTERGNAQRVEAWDKIIAYLEAQPK